MPYPKLVTEPITRLQWVARSRAEALLAWWPMIAVLLAFGLGAAAAWACWVTGVV